MEAASQSRKDKLLALRKRKADEEAGLIAPGSSRPKLRGTDQQTETELDIQERKEREEKEKKKERNDDCDGNTSERKWKKNSKRV